MDAQIQALGDRVAGRSSASPGDRARVQALVAPFVAATESGSARGAGRYARRWFADGKLVVEREVLSPGGHVLGDQRQFEPDGVEIGVASSNFSGPVCLAVPGSVFAVGAGRGAGVPARSGRRQGPSLARG